MARTGTPGGQALSQALTLRDAQALVDDWMRERGWSYWHPLSQLARMAEELGEVARLVNHLYGEKPKKPEESEQDLGLEMADLFYTMICLANDQGVDLQSALERVLEKYGGRDASRYPSPAPSPLPGPKSDVPSPTCPSAPPQGPPPPTA